MESAPALLGPADRSSLGTAAINLNGGTLNFTGNDYGSAPGVGLTTQVYNQQVSRNARIEFSTVAGVTGLLNTSTPETLAAPNALFTNAVSDVDFPNTGFGNNAPFGPIGNTAIDNVFGFWRGSFDAGAGGSFTFGSRSDDGSVVIVDGQYVVNNNNLQAATTVRSTITLTAGLHEILVGFYEASGGGGMQAFAYAGATGAGTGAGTANVPAAIEIANLSSLAAQPQTTLGNNVSLTASSAIRAKNTYGVTLGSLTVAADALTLTTGGSATDAGDGLTRFTSTNLSAADTFDAVTHSDLALGTLNDGGTTLTINKSGNGNLILDSTVTAATASNTTLNVNGGQLLAQRTNTANNPLGSATVNLNGLNSTLQLNILEIAAGNVSFATNSMNVTANANIEATNRSTSNRTVTLGDATHGVNISGTSTLRAIATSNASLQFDGVLSGAGNLDVTFNNGIFSDNGSGAQGTVIINATPTFIGSTTIQNSARLQLNVANAIDTSSGLNILAGGTLAVNQANALDGAAGFNLISGARVEYVGASSFANNTNATDYTDNVGSLLRISNATAINGTFAIKPGRILELNLAGGLSGSGMIDRAPGSILTLLNGSNNALDGAQLPASSIRALDVVRVEATLTGEGDNIIATGLAATKPAAIILINANNRVISSTTLQEINGQILTQDNAGREISDGAGLDINAGGAVLASTSTQTLTVREDIEFTNSSGKVTIGANIPLDGLAKSGAVLLTNTSNLFNSRTTNVVDIVAGAVLATEGAVSGITSFGTAAAAHLGVNLFNGTLRIQQPTTAVAGISTTVGQVNITGLGTLNVNRGTPAGNTTTMRLDDPLIRSNRGVLGLLASNNSLGTDERVIFNTASEAPSRLTSTSAATINAVSPQILNISAANTASFVDYDPVGTNGFVNTTYSAFAAGNLTGATDVTIADVTTAAAAVGVGGNTVGLLRTSQDITGAGNNLTIDRGGIIIASTTARTISANLTAPAGVEMFIHSTGGAIHTVSGVITSDSGLSKWGASTLTLTGNNSTTLTGDIVIMQSVLSANNNNALGVATNDVVLNGGGVLRTSMASLPRDITIHAGGGGLQVDGNTTVTQGAGTSITGTGMLTVSQVNGTANTPALVLTQTNTFEGGLTLNSGTIRFSTDNQLGASSPALGTQTLADYDQGHIVLNGGELELASGAGGSVTVDRQFTVRSASTLEVAGASDRLTLARDMRDSGTLSKIGAGTLALASLQGNGLTGAVNVNAGTLLANNTNLLHTATGAGAVTVNNAGTTLGGTGSIGGATTLNTGTFLRPGDLTVAAGIGTLTFHRNLTLSAGSIAELDIAGVTTTDATVPTLSAGTVAYESYVSSQANTWNGLPTGAHDVLAGDHPLTTLDINGTLRFAAPSFTFDAGQVFDMLDWTGLITNLNTGASRYSTGGVVGDLELPTLTGDLQWDTGLLTSHGVLVIATVVPEPSRALLIFMGTAALVLHRRRRN